MNQGSTMWRITQATKGRVRTDGTLGVFSLLVAVAITALFVALFIR